MSSDEDQTGGGGSAVPPRPGSRRKPGSAPFAAAPTRPGKAAGSRSGQRQGQQQGQQASFRARKRRRQQLIGGGIIGVVVIVIVVLVAVGLGSSSSSPGPTGSTAVASGTLDSVNSIGVGQIAAAESSNKAANPPIKAGGALLTSGGKPEVLYMGAEYCPYCAGERWPLVLALSQFGSFSNLHSISSTADDQPASIPTYTFLGSTFTSPYITFTSVELQDIAKNPLQKPTAEQQALLAKYDGPPYVPAGSAGGIPFIDLGGYSVQDGLGYSLPGGGDSALSGLTFANLAGQVATQTGSNAAAIDAEAGTLISNICKIDGGKSLDGDAACKAFPTPITQAPAGA